MKQSIKIIGGKYRGKKLNFLAIDALRPTANRIKETLFNWLMHDIRKADCLDAFAGSGALGLEALSRGANSITLIEHDDLAFKHLKNLCSSFAEKNIFVIHDDANNYIKKTNLLKNKFNIIFVDPPFQKPFPYAFIENLINSNLITEDALLYVEYKEAVILDQNIWLPLKQKQSGQVVYALYKKISST